MTSTQFAAVTAVATSIKILLVPCYHSTDLEVHRNWMAITHSLPIKSWYFEASSEWTLDYPPFFAYFEWFLSHIAVYLDKDIVKLSKMPYETSEAILFQRFSVILSDFFLIFAAWRFVHSVSFPSSANAPAPGSTILSISPGERKKNLAVFSMIILNVGLLLVDHIHFQYNGLLMGLLILSFDAANRGNHIMLTVYFSVLVLMKHLFVFFVPVFGLYLLRSYCGWDGFNFRVDSRPESFDLTSDSDNSCDVSDRITYSEESPLSDKISSLKPSTVLTLPQSTVSGKGKKKKKKQVQNVLKISPINTGEIKIKVTNSNIEGKKCSKADVKNKIDKKNTKTGLFFRRFFILVCIAVIALTAAFGPFIIDFSSLEGAQSESIIRAKECRRNSVTNIFDEIEDDNMNCDNIEERERERGREIGDRKRFSISLEYDQITQIFQRLFPFGRGLVHAYWAPNVWALYCGVDKTADLILRKRKQIGRIFLRKFRAVHKISKNTFWLSNMYLRKFSDYGSYLIKKWDKNNSFMLMTFQLSIEMDILKNHFKSHYHKIKDSIITNFKIVANSKEFKAMKENGISYLKNRDNLTSAEGDDLVSSSSGLIGNFRLFILPNISASLALLFTIISMFPAFFVLVYNRKYDGLSLSLSVGHIRSDDICLNSSSNEIVKDEVAVAVAGVGVTGVRTGSLAGAGVGSGTGVGVGVGCMKSVKELGHLVNHTNTHTNTNINTYTMQRNSIKHNAHITPNLLIRSVLYTSLCSFMLGYHVHEKAIIIPMLCAAIMSSRSNRDAVLFIKLSAIGVFSLFPLFTGIDELMIKSFFLLTYITCCWKYFEKETKDENWSLKTHFSILFTVFVFTEIIHPYYFVYLPSVKNREKVDTAILPFLPLITVSCVCGLLLVPCWIEAGILLLQQDCMTD